jgi:hypothetical protein
MTLVVAIFIVSLKRVVIRRREGKAVKSRGLLICIAITRIKRDTEKFRESARSIKNLGRGKMIKAKRRIIPITAERLYKSIRFLKFRARSIYANSTSFSLLYKHRQEP